MSDMSEADFFISYNSRNEKWAEWIAWFLEEAGFTTIVQAWDFRPGGNFVLEMQLAAERTERTIAVLSPHYLGSEFVKPEWAAAFAGDPTGLRRTLVPVRVAHCEVPGMLRPLAYIDLVGLDQSAAAAKLLAGVRPGRAKPLTPPAFPGTGSQTVSPAPLENRLSVSPGLDWVLEAKQPDFFWRTTVNGGHVAGAVLEVHLVPVEPQRIEVRKLAELADELVGLGRQAGLLDPLREVHRTAGDQLAAVYSAGRQSDAGAGLIISRAGQRGAWFSLPRDHLGSVYDSADVTPRLQAVLTLLMTIPLPVPARFTVAARIDPIMMVQTGRAALVNARSTAQMPFATRAVPPVLPQDSASTATITAHIAAFAQEVVARLEATMRT